MSMLAEKKRREKWSLNPRGKAWSDDQTKFGQQLLEKMGWSTGQGLGINNQGSTEIVKVKKKDNCEGFGYKENGEEWLKTTNDFNKLLDELGSSVEEESKEQINIASSLEDRSKKSRSRVHYHKFMRGKDLSRYSEKDLASIIGPNVVKQKYDKADTNYTESQVNKGSSADYFSSKNRLEPKHSPEKICSEKEGYIIPNEDKSNPNKKKIKKSKTKNVDNEPDIELHTELKVLSKHKKHTKNCYNGESFDNDVDESCCDVADSEKVSKKKRKHRHNETEMTFVLEQTKKYHENHEASIFDHDKNNVVLFKENSENKFKETGDNYENVEINQISKFKKTNLQENSGPCEVQPDENYSNLEDGSKKKKKKGKHGLDLALILEPSSTPDEPKETFKSPKVERKLRKKAMLEEVAPEHVIHTETSEEQTAESVEDRSKKKKRKHDLDVSLLLEPSTPEEPKETLKSTKVERKLRKKSMLEEVACDNFIHTETSKEHTVDSIEYGSKKKKRKHDLDASLILEPSTLEEPKKTFKSPKVEKKLRKEAMLEEVVGDNFIHNETSGKQTMDSKKSKKNLKRDRKFEGNVREENEEIAVKSEQTCPLKKSNKYLEVLVRKTRLKKINVPLSTENNNKYETKEFMAFSPPDLNMKFPVSSHSNTIDLMPEHSSSQSNYNTQFIKVYGEPNKHDCNIPKHVIAFEYRQLTKKLKQLKIAAPEVKVIIKDSVNLSQATHRKLKTLHKSKQLKALLPSEHLAEVESSVNKFSEELQPKIDMMNALVEIEEKTNLLAQELTEKSTNVDTSLLTEGINSYKMTAEVYAETTGVLQNMSTQLQLLLEDSSPAEAETPTLNAKVDSVSLKTRSNMCSGPNSGKKQDSKVTSHRITRKLSLSKEDSPHLSSLQTKIEERLRVLAEQMKLLKEGKIPFVKQHKQAVQNQNLTFRRGRSATFGRNRRSMYGKSPEFLSKENILNKNISDFENVEEQGNPTETTQFIHCGGRGRPGIRGSVPFGGWGVLQSYGMGFESWGDTPFPSRGQFYRNSFGVGRGRGRGRGDLRGRGRISQNNFDAKLYAEKCKALNRVPELAFRGVDLKIISGYAAGKEVGGLSVSV